MSKGVAKKRVAARPHFAARHIENFTRWLCGNGYTFRRE